MKDEGLGGRHVPIFAPDFLLLTSHDKQNSGFRLSVVSNLLQGCIRSPSFNVYLMSQVVSSRLGLMLSGAGKRF